MSDVKKNTNVQKYLAFGATVFFILFLSGLYVYADVSTSFKTGALIATQGGSSSSIITIHPDARYVNKGENSSVIHNYFSGYYHDSRFGSFKFDWGTPNQNVRVVGSTAKCGSGYGYKLGGFAKSKTAGFVDFDYNTNIFVYYCEVDSSLHGFAYSDQVGLQNFKGIQFNIDPTTVIVEEQVTSTGTFVNDVLTPSNPTVNTSSPTPTGSIGSSNAINSNDEYNSLQHDIYELESEVGNTFYIVK